MGDATAGADGPKGGAICQDCDWRAALGEEARRPAGRSARDLGSKRCPRCGSPRRVAHAELFSLHIAHVDCDAFYAAVEKRDRPELRDKPVIVGGGGDRGVVTTACYLARIHGVRSAMPMARARALCPNAVIIQPEMAKYAEASRRIRALFDALTPLVEPLSLDEAFLDLSGTERLHGMPPAAALGQLARRVVEEVGVTVSVGLSWNKFLAKVASDLDKPRGFSVIGRAETLDFLVDKPVSLIWGVGAATEARLQADGYRTIGDLRRAEEADLIRAYGGMGGRLARLARGEDARAVSRRDRAKSLSAETTFDRDLDPAARPGEREALDLILWSLSERASARMKSAGLEGRTVVLTLKTSAHQRLSRRRRLETPSALAETLYRTAQTLLDAELSRLDRAAPRYRLAGVGYADLVEAADSTRQAVCDAQKQSTKKVDPMGAQLALLDTGDADSERTAQVERTVDALRQRFGAQAVQKGRGFRKPHSR
ncbi:MAG: DNA polymerase IV [Pseudomonadota bacterium]